MKDIIKIIYYTQYSKKYSIIGIESTYRRLVNIPEIDFISPTHELAYCFIQKYKAFEIEE